jgi:hypothetical protein
MISSEENMILMLRQLIKKQDEALRLVYQISNKAVPDFKEKEKEKYLSNVKRRLGLE